MAITFHSDVRFSCIIYRHSIERLPEVALEAYTWQHSGKLLGMLYEQLMQGPRPSEIVGASRDGPLTTNERVSQPKFDSAGV